MTSQTIPLAKTNQFSNIFLDYVHGVESLKPFYHNHPSIENFEKQIKEKKFEKNKRDLLVKVLKEQYQGSVLSEKQKTNLEVILKENTFTITTGHQLCLATGPLYFIYKILTVISLCKELKSKYPDYHFVPVFWMATEDHDIAEINHFHLFGKKHEWPTAQTGAAGKLLPEGLKEVFDQIRDFPEWLSYAYLSADTLSAGTRNIASYLFGEQGLLALDGDDANLKSDFKEIIQNDLFENKYAPVVRKTSELLQSKGYKSQAFVRDQNFFFLEKNSRERIEKDGDIFHVVNTGKQFTETELKSELSQHPEKFSPNVILRPLYQEMVLPNLAYIGGPGEIAYWLQLKEVFELESIPFPILFPRKFYTISSQTVSEKLIASNLSPEDLFKPEKEFHEIILEKLKVEKLDFSEEDTLLAQLRAGLIQKATIADKSFFPAVEAEISKAEKGIQELGKRLNKAMENKHETELGKLKNLRKKLFPDNELQERHDNFLNFFINDPGFTDKLLAAMDPFLFQMEFVTL